MTERHDTFMMRPHRLSRVVDTEELRELNERAIERGFSRTLDPYAFLEIDPNGLHILTRVHLMFLPFARMEIMLKTTTSTLPRQAILDLEDEWLEELTTLAEYRQAQRYYENQSLVRLRDRLLAEQEET